MAASARRARKTAPEAKESVLGRLAAARAEFTPQLKKAAAYVLDHPNDVGVRSMRQIAEAAGVNPNTLVRLARELGYEGYTPFRRPFSEHLRRGVDAFPDRARWLQSLGRGNSHARLYSDMASASISAVENMFAGVDADAVKALADCIVGARRTFVLGVGVGRAAASEFAYLARMALDSVELIPADSGLPMDGAARMRRGDILLAMTFAPFRRDVTEAVRLAKDRGAVIAAVSDSRAAPIVPGADHVFIVPTETPHFFTSMTAVTALIETLIAFIVADAEPEVIERIGAFHHARRDAGIYTGEDG
ncbi:MAG: MurR/RpiR family transcriptional regulator [Rhodospirillales bacterium]